MLGRLANYLNLAFAYVRFNLAAQLEYRGAFASQVLAMFLNDGVWVVFWVLFFSRFPVLHGWTIKDVLTIWGVVCVGYGLAHSFCGSIIYLPTIITRGQLDVWLVYPRAVLPHLLVGRMSVSAWGDIVFGFAVYLLFVQPDLVHFALFTLLTVSVAFLYTGFGVLTGSLAFYLGNAEGLAEQWRYSLTTFSTYPVTLFDGAVKILLFTAIPAGFASYLPVVALRELSPVAAVLSVLGALGICTVGTIVFYHGLSRYESGNLTEMRG
jgi:ABC-2 type transport system permease protein